MIIQVRVAVIITIVFTPIIMFYYRKNTVENFEPYLKNNVIIIFYMVTTGIAVACGLFGVSIGVLEIMKLIKIILTK